MAQEIIIEIPESGETKIEIKGIVGASCKDVTKDIEKALGNTSSTINTPEFYQKPIQKRIQNQ